MQRFIRDHVINRRNTVPDNMVEISKRRYLVCSECKRPLKQGYDSPRGTLPGEYHPVLCGPDYKKAFAGIYPDEAVPNVSDGFLEQI